MHLLKPWICQIQTTGHLLLVVTPIASCHSHLHPCSSLKVRLDPYPIHESDSMLLLEIGVADELYRDRIQPYNCMKVSDGVTNASIEFDTSLLSSSTNPDDLPIAYMIENVHLQHSILKTLQTSKGKGATVDILQKARVASIRMQEQDAKETKDTLDLSDWPIIEMENGQSLQARLLVRQCRVIGRKEKAYF